MSEARLRNRTRVLNACQRCRKRKIKCSGTQPCRTCIGRGLRCDFGAEDKKVIISEKELLDLRTKIQQLERAMNEQAGSNRSTYFTPLQSQHRSVTAVISNEIEKAQARRTNENTKIDLSRRSSTSSSSVEDTENLGNFNIPNPLVPGQPVYISESSGKLRYLGHCSGYAFAQQVLHILQQYPPSNPSPEIILTVGGQEQRPESGRLTPLLAPDISRLPSRGTAMHYLQCLKFRTEPLFYLFYEPDFVSRLNQFYEDPTEYATASMVWFVHYLVLMAFGKALDPYTQMETSHGALVQEHFTRALKLIPDMTYLCDHPVEATELCCSVALYLHSINHRQAAIIYSSQAIRLAQLYALHLDLQESIIGTNAVERGRRVWWTVYALNSKLTSSLGLPNFIDDKDMTSRLPVVSECDEDGTALAIHVKICRLLGLLISRVYVSSEESQRSFVSATKKVLKGAVRVANDIKQYAEKCFGEISRVVAHLDLAYHHCVIVACRPALFYLLTLRSGDCRNLHQNSRPSSLTGLIQTCMDSAAQAIKTLVQLQEHNLLDTFLPFDLECAFSAAFVLVMAGGIEPKIITESQHLESIDSAQYAKQVIGDIASRGNTQAKVRKMEIQQLEELLHQHVENHQRNTDLPLPQSLTSTTFTTQSEPFEYPHLGTPFFTGWNFNAGLSGDQILNLADALDVDDFAAFNSVA